MGVIVAIGKWLVSSRLGQSLLLALAVMLAVYVTYKYVDNKAYQRGKLDCTTGYIAKTAVENQRQARENERRNRAASEVANKADAKGQEAVTAVDNKTNTAREEIRYVYRDAPRTKPVAGACVRVHPVDARVQDQFREAFNRANGQ